MNKNQTKLVQKLESALTEEKEILLKGKFEELKKFIKKKQSLCDEISIIVAPFDPKILKKIETLATQNQNLYIASQRGIAVARARLEEMQQVVSSLKTYSDKGQMKSEDTSNPKLSLKA